MSAVNKLLPGISTLSLVSLEVPSREEASSISENPEPPRLPHKGHLGVGEGVNSPFLEGCFCGCWDYDTSAAQRPYQLKEDLQR